MAVITLRTPGKLEVVESIEQLTGVAGEDLTAGQVVRINPAGRFVKADATLAANAKAYGMVVKTVRAGMAVTAVAKGVVDGFALDALAYNDDVFLSNTAGAIDTTAGTVSKVIGTVIPAHGQLLGASPDKLLRLAL